MINKIKHFYFNKYIVKPFSKRKYYLSYDFKHKALWFRVYKVGTRTIDNQLKKGSNSNDYIYSSAVGYNPSRYKDFFKFAFVRNPIDRFISAWKDKVLKQNYFKFNTSEHDEMKDINNFIEWVKTFNIQDCDEHLLEQCSLIDIDNIDFIGRFENFEKDFNYVIDKLGLDPYDGVHLNKSKKYNITITKKNEMDIATIYKKDFITFYPDEFKLLQKK